MRSELFAYLLFYVSIRRLILWFVNANIKEYTSEYWLFSKLEGCITPLYSPEVPALGVAARNLEKHTLVRFSKLQIVLVPRSRGEI